LQDIKELEISRE